MAHDRESQGSTGGTGYGGTTGGSTDFGSTGTGGTTGFGSTGGIGGTTRETDDLGTRAGSYDRSFTDEGGNIKERVSDKLEEGKHAVSDAADSGRSRVADQLARVGTRLEERAREMENAGGVQRRAGQVARRASGALDNSADYLRNHEFGEMRDDLETAIRERPLLSVGMAVGAGFLLARILRD